MGESPNCSLVSNLSRRPTYHNLAMDNNSDTSSQSSCCSCRCKKSSSTPRMRAPLMDIRNFTTKTKLRKVVTPRAGWNDTPASPRKTPQDSVVVVSPKKTEIEDRPPKLSSQRLRSVRSLFDGFALSILKTGTVVLEKLTTSRQAIKEIVQVSGDGDSITTAKFKQNCIAFNDSYPTTIDKLLRHGFSDVDVRTFRYDSMPRKLFGRYRCAANFVNIARARTPKVTITRTIKGKAVNCCLMESTVDCEVTFSVPGQPNSCVITFLPSKMTRIQAGTAVLMLPGDENGEDTHLFEMPKQIREMVGTAKSIRQAALSIEKSISQQPNGIVQFPIECGQRRAQF